jgi:hypothetical protein
MQQPTINKSGKGNGYSGQEQQDSGWQQSAKGDGSPVAKASTIVQ